MGIRMEGLGEARVDYPRIIGRFGGNLPGPKTLVVGGIHGNEPAGLIAARRVIDRLEKKKPKFRGELVAFAGNTRALSRGVRFLERDLNRIWTPDAVDRVLRYGPGATAAVDESVVPNAEEVEQRELISAIREEASSAEGQVFFFDLHTSSADGAPFITIGDTLRNRSFARRLPLPVILGLEEQIDGALLEYMNNLGYTTIGIEAGQHESERSNRRMESALTLALVHAGHLDIESAPSYQRHYELLDKSRRGVPHVIEVRHRHIVRPGDGFRMRPGYTNFDKIRKGEPLADDAHGTIEAPETGRILLPLYQGQGNDGFFVCRRFSPFWLTVSRTLRRWRVGDVVKLMPGITPHAERPGTLVVDTRVARLFPLQIFHLLGFRKLRRQGNVLLVTRRNFDNVTRY